MWQTKFGTCIYTSPSGYKLYENFFFRWLTLGSDALQTVISKRNPKKPILYYLPALTLMARTLPNNSCILGVGGAGVAQMLASKDYSISAIDSSDEILYIAQRYFMIDQLPNLNLIHQNAENYVQTCTHKYPHLIVDLYNANQFPQECNNDHFFLQCKNLLEKDGFFSINLANIKEQWPIYQLIKRCFKNTLIIPIKKCSNMIIIASEHESRDLFIKQTQQNNEIKNIALVSSWGHVAEYRS